MQALKEQKIEMRIDYLEQSFDACSLLAVHLEGEVCARNATAQVIDLSLSLSESCYITRIQQKETSSKFPVI